MVLAFKWGERIIMPGDHYSKGRQGKESDKWECGCSFYIVRVREGIPSDEGIFEKRSKERERVSHDVG